MKRIVFLLGLLLLISCSKSKEEMMKSNITSDLKKVIDDSSTFEFVSMNIKKTITVGERKKVMNEGRLIELEDLYKKRGWCGDPTEEIQKMLNQQKMEMEFLKNKDDNLEAVYYVDFIARGSNKFGAIIKANYSATVLNDDNLTVVHFKSMN